MAKHVNLDAMIRREDFAVQTEDKSTVDLLANFAITNLDTESPIRKLLRKPDFQRETNRWTADQLATFIASFVDSEVIPSIILWQSPTYIFVIDGGHRLSALRAWMEDDYGDGPLSFAFFGNDISEEQKRIAKRARQLIEQRVGRYSTLKSQVDSSDVNSEQVRRAKTLFTRALNLQWVQGDAAKAETSFFKINSQGTPLDDTEKLLITNRKKPIAIAARAILRAGSGHKYWSSFPNEQKKRIEEIAQRFHKLLFEPEADTPIKTLDVPLGGSISPIEALSLLIEFLTISASRAIKAKAIDEYDSDASGEDTIEVLLNSIQVLERITGNGPESLGLHPAVYFYNEKGKYSRFLFLGMTALLTEKLRNNDKQFFNRFTKAREKIEQFLIDNKSLIGIIPQNQSKAQRVPKIKDLFDFLVQESITGLVKPEDAIAHMDLKVRIFDITSKQGGSQISDDTKSALFIQNALKNPLRCPACKGILDPPKSISYDHITPVSKGGSGASENAQMLHPYCNSTKEKP